MIKIMCALQTKNTSESDPQLQKKPPKINTGNNNYI